MQDENGKELSEKEIIKESLNMIGDACCFLFELESDNGKALAFMVDAALKYGQVIHKDGDVLLAAADYSKFEEDVYQKLNPDFRR